MFLAISMLPTNLITASKSLTPKEILLQNGDLARIWRWTIEPIGCIGVGPSEARLRG